MGDVLRVTVIATGFKGEGFKNQPAYKLTPNSHNLNKAMTRTPTPSRIDNFMPKKKENEDRNLFQKRENSVNLSENFEYINEGNLPSLVYNPEEFDDYLDVPVFQRPKVTGKKND